MPTLATESATKLDIVPADFTSIQLGQLPLSDAEAKVALRLSHALHQPALSIEDFLRLKRENLKDLDGVGIGYLDQMDALQGKLPLLGLRHWAAMGHAESRKLQIRDAILPPVNRKSLEKLKRHTGLELSSLISAATLLQINYTQLESESGWGKVMVDPLRELCHVISKRIGGLLESESESNLPSFFTEELAFNSAAKIDDCLASSIERCLVNLDNPRSRLVLECRLGISRKKETLEAVGLIVHETGFSKAVITRERVRQIEKHEKSLLFSSMQVSRESVIQAAKPNPTSRPADILIKTAALFHSNELFLAFLSEWSGQNKGDLRMQETKGVFESLYPLFETVRSPYSEQAIISALQKAHHNSEEDCTEQIRLMIKERYLDQSPSGALTPSRLPARVAVPNYYLESELGLHWAETMEFMEDADLLSEPFPEERAFQVRVQTHPLLFFCGPAGTYRHRNFHNLPDASALPWIRFVKSRLGKKAENLRYWFHKQNLYEVVDYYELRDIIKRLGKKEGLYFWGQSRRETVALDPNASSVPNDAVVVEFLEVQARPMSRVEIHQGLPFIEDSTLDLQLAELTHAGKIRKPDLRHWSAL